MNFWEYLTVSILGFIASILGNLLAGLLEGTLGIAGFEYTFLKTLGLASGTLVVLIASYLIQRGPKTRRTRDLQQIIKEHRIELRFQRDRYVGGASWGELDQRDWQDHQREISRAQFQLEKISKYARLSDKSIDTAPTPSLTSDRIIIRSELWLLLLIVISFCLAYLVSPSAQTALLRYMDGFNNPTPDAEFYYQRGNRYYDNGECDLAIADYNRAIQLEPSREWFYNNRGNAYYKKGEKSLKTSEYDKAIEDYNKAIELIPAFFWGYNGRGNAYNRKGEYDRAIEDYSEAIKLNSDFADAYSGRGWAHNEKGEYDRAIVDLDKAIELDPGLAWAYNNRGNAYYGKGEYEQAIVDLDKAIELDPSLAWAYLNRGNTLYEIGDLDQAIVDYETVIELNNNPIVHKFAKERLRELRTNNNP